MALMVSQSCAYRELIEQVIIVIVIERERQRDRDRERDRDRGFGCIASCVPSPLCCKPLSKLLLHVLMSEWSEVASRPQRRCEIKSHGWKAQSELRALEWQCTACKTQSFLSRWTCRGCSKQRDTKQDEFFFEWSQSVSWSQQSGCGESLGQQTEGTGPSSCDGQTTTGSGQSRGDARSVPSHLGERGATAGDGHETSPALGTENGRSEGPISSRCRFRREGDASAAEGTGEFRASEAGGDASPDRPGPAHAGSPTASDASSTSQREPGQNLGSFDRDHRKLLESRCRTTTRALDTRNPGVEANSSDLFGSHVSGGAALDADFAAGQEPEPCDLEEDDAEEMADFEEAHALGGPPVEATVSRARKTATGNTPKTPPPRKTRTAAPADAAQSGAHSSQAQRLSARAMTNPKTRNFWRCRNVLVRSSQHWQVPEGSITIFGIVALVCSGTQPGRHWPA